MSDRGLSLPSEPAATKGLPENFLPIPFEGYNGLNTKQPRPAIKDDECAWIDGFMPYAPSVLKILWGAGPTVYTARDGVSFVWLGFGNIGDTEYGIVVNTDGSVEYFNTDTAGSGGIMVAGSLANPRSIFGFSQWGSQYLIFCADQENGYWLWDGTNLFGAGTISPFVEVTNGGENYTSPPTISVTSTEGSLVAASAQITGGSVVKVTVTAPGTGFLKNSFATLTFTGGGSDDMATATANLSPGGGVTGVVITNPGAGYTFNATLVISGGGGTGATGVLNIQNGQIVSVAMINEGHGYTSLPTLAINDPGYGSGGNHINGGSGADGFPTIGANSIATVTVGSGGTGYTSVPGIEIIGDGAGATAVAEIAGGAVTAINVTNPGQGYTKALVRINGGNNAANANVKAMPFGISGTTVEVYQSRVWIANGAAVADFPPKNRVIFSDPNSPSSFGTGGGAFLGTDSFLRVGYHSLKQSNGFLYLIGDSSMNYISGVTTSAASATAGPVTTFGNQNVDPQLGSPWASSVQVFSRNIVFANSLGVFVSYGGAVTKASEPLDGFYGSGNIYGLTSNFSSAVANIFGVAVYMLLLPVIDPVTQVNAAKLLMWDGKKWFTSVQDKPLTYIATQEINSVLTAWGTDGTHVFRLFNQKSTGFTKTVQSKLYSKPSYFMNKTGMRLHEVGYSSGVSQPLTITIDTEKGVGTGNADLTVLMQAGLNVLGPYPVAQQGRMLGMTMTTNLDDGELLSLTTTGQSYTGDV